MKMAPRTAIALVLMVILVGASACRIPGGSAAGTPQPSSSSKATPSPPGPLDAPVPMLTGFPPDVPIYTGARLTAGAAFAANGQTTWGMEWETLDTVDKVQAFYAGKLSQGDWTVQISGVANPAVSPAFHRQTTPHFAALLATHTSSGP